MKNPGEHWNRIYASRTAAGDPAAVLTRYSHLLPAAGEALDLACGLGANAQFLATRGFVVDAWDISDVAIRQLRFDGVKAVVRDVTVRPPLPGTFDLIVVSRFLERSLCPFITDALRPGGLLFYQTFVADKPPGTGPSNPDFLLGANELLRLFADLTVRAFHDEGTVGDPDRGSRCESLLVAQRS